MNIIKKVFINILIGYWLIVALFTTFCLINFNKYRVTEFGNTSLVIMDNDSLEPKYKKGSLVVVNKDNLSSYKIGDKVFYYKPNSKDFFINYGEILKIQKVNDREYTFNVSNQEISSAYVAGNESTAKVYNNVGSILAVLESRWGFMLFIILPTVFAFVYEVYAISVEVKKEMKNKDKEEKNTKDNINTSNKTNDVEYL